MPNMIQAPHAGMTHESQEVSEAIALLEKKGMISVKRIGQAFVVNL